MSSLGKCSNRADRATVERIGSTSERVEAFRQCWRRLRAHAHDRRSERGSEIVEFALMLPVLVTLALGSIDTGFVLNDAIKLRSTTREAARLGAVHAYGTNANCALTGPVANATPAEAIETKRLMCRLKVYAADVGLDIRSAVVVVDDYQAVTAYQPYPYVEGNQLILCTEIVTSSRSGLFRPLYNSRVLHNRVTMRIAEIGSVVGPAASGYEAPFDAPSGSTDAQIAARWNTFCNATTQGSL